MTGRALDEFWKGWVFDYEKVPIKLEPHPHDAFRFIARFVAAFLGSIPPFGLILIRLVSLDELDKIDIERKLGDFFWVVVAVFVATWLISVLRATAAKERTFMRYVSKGSITPAYLIVLLVYWESFIK